MSDFPGILAPSPSIIDTTNFAWSPVGRLNMVLSNHGYSSTAWSAANRAIYVPIEVQVPIVAKQIIWENGGTASGNIDVGIYAEDGTRIVSLGSTATSGTSVIQAGDITDTPLNPGNYYLAMLVDNTTHTIVLMSSMFGEAVRMCGQRTQDVGAATLPATATFATAATGHLPYIGLVRGAVV
jgi:hypothetical protein